MVVSKRSVTAKTLTFSPDPVVGHTAIGDVKYSLDQGMWRRSDVYQLLAFATAFQVDATLLVNLATLRWRHASRLSLG